jgi:hypothetical protein
MKKFIWLLPIIAIIFYQLLTGELIPASGIGKIWDALCQLGPRLALNTILVGIAIIIILLCGMRIYGFIFSVVKPGLKLNFSSGLLSYFVIGSLFTFIIMMTIGVMGVYFPVVNWGAALILIFFPYRLKIFLHDLKEFVQRIKISFNLDFHLFGSALVFFGLPLLLLQLTNMVPPWMDILEVYVAPVQRILSFGQYIPHDALPFALYNSSRSVPLFTAFYGFIASLTGMEASQAIVASSIYILFFSLLAVYHTGNVLGESPCGGIAVWLFSLSINFLSLSHGRSGVLVMLFFIPAIAFFYRILLSETPNDKLLFAVLTGLALGGASLAHPLIGIYSLILVCFVSVIIMLWTSPRFGYWLLYILIIAGFTSACLVFQTRELVHFSWLQAFLIWIALGVLSGFGLYCAGLWIKKHPEPEVLPRYTKKSWLPPVAIILAVFIATVFSWRYHWMNETPMYFMFIRLPFFIGMGFVAAVRVIYLYWKNKAGPLLDLKIGTSLLFMAGGFLLMAVPLYILPLFPIEDSVGASLCQELPSKGLNYWLNPLLVVFAPLCISGFQKKVLKDAFILLLLYLMVMPLFSLLPKFNFTDEARLCWPTVTQWQLQVAANGYFGGYGDDRKLMSADDHKLVDYLRGLINTGKLKISDTIYHIAEEQHPWSASPFPTFTGVRQSLLLVKRDPGDINTKWGRITDFPNDFHLDAPEKWVLAEKCVIEKYPDFFHQFREKYNPLFENHRLILFERKQL